MTVRTLTRADINRLTMNAWSRASGLAGGGRNWLTQAEVNKNSAADRAAFRTLFKAALKTRGTRTAVRVGDIYAEAKKAATEIRKVADTKGNKDRQLQPRERRYLSSEARA